jgi:MarR family transcriptional regulator, temperature-dependent positive regulator of motility
MSQPATLALVLHLSKAVHRASSEELLGMKLRQFIVLSYLDRRAPARQQDLCETLMVDANNCVLMLNELEAQGWTERRRDTADRRRHVVDITDAGRKALARAQQAQEQLEGEILAGLDAAERDQLRELLLKALRRVGERQPAAAAAAEATA